jgi:hypothetical protein
MDNSLARLDLTEIFCDVDDFYQVLSHVGEAVPKLPYDGEAKQYRSKLSLSEVSSSPSMAQGFVPSKRSIPSKCYPIGKMLFLIW